MSGSCCGGSAKSEPNNVAMTTAPKATEAVAQQTAADSEKSECCKDTPAKNEKHGCGC
jgi:hypothetical protein